MGVTLMLETHICTAYSFYKEVNAPESGVVEI